MVHFWKYIIMRTWFKQKICEEKEEKGEKALFVSTGAKGLIDWENIGKRTQVVWFNWQKVVQETFGNVGHALKCCFTLVWGEVVNETRVWLSFWTIQLHANSCVYICMHAAVQNSIIAICWIYSTGIHRPMILFVDIYTILKGDISHGEGVHVG